MSTINRLKQEVSFLITVLFCLTGAWTTAAVAAETFCASVKIEIRQQLSLERQAFDAHMRINNGLSNIDLTDLHVIITFTDEDGNPVIATTDPNDSRNYPAVGFFIRKDSDNIIACDSEGSWAMDDVVASSSSDLHWLIIPVPGSAGDQPDGKLYYVGAKLSYRMGTGGDEQVVTVTPDYIYVKPLPDLTLDYFLTRQVYGDDPLTTDIEPSVPFTLGVRAKNTGNNTAYNLKIDSAQPKIVENSQDLLIGFSIIGSEVNGVTTDNSLLVDLGDVAPGQAAVGRWLMVCSLAGEFTEFNARVSHADGLGGQVTSIITGINTMSLAKDVLVDLPGRDSVADFLTRNIEAPYAITKICESEAVDDVWDSDVVTYVASFVESGGLYKLDFIPSGAPGEFVYVKVGDPFNGQKAIREAIRSDGKRIKHQNAWLSKERTDPDNPEAGWSYFVNLFDVNSTGKYDVAFGTGADNQAPSFVPVLSKTGVEGQALTFEVQAIDPEGVTPRLSISNLPDDANFTDNGDGTGTFTWTPSPGQAGSYLLSFRATDGQDITMQIVPVTILAGDDSDNDGMADSWEMEHFGNLDRDGSGDFDGDGISDLDEYVNGTDPTREDHGPSAPAILSPGDGQDVTALSPTLEINNSIDPDGDALTYDFEVCSDPQFTNQVAAAQNVAETAPHTAWIVSAPLNDNTLYYWRIRAFDGVGYSLWTYGTFFVNTVNDAPGTFHIRRPAADSSVDKTTPVLEVTNSIDIDRDILTYTFEVYSDVNLTTAITSASGTPQGADGVTAWTVDTALADGVQYYWRAIAVDPHGGQTATATGSFTVLLSNQAPTAPAISTPAYGSTVTANNLDIIVVGSADADNDTLVYDFQIDTVNTFDGPALVTAEGVTGDVWSAAWHVTDLANNTTYYWRARAFDGQACGPWVAGRFFVNPVNEVPLAPTLKNPGENAWVNTLTPELSVHPAIDPDGDSLTYYFEVYADSALGTPVFTGTSSQPSLVASSGLSDNTRYYWRAMAEDPAGEISGWTATATFFVKAYSSAPDELTVNVTTDDGDPLANVSVYAFSASGTYTGLNSITDADGVARFAPGDFADGNYKFRVDYLGSQFWTDTIAMPGTASVDGIIDVQTVEVTVSTAAGAAADIPVYVFTGNGAYLGLNTTTGADGKAVFTLPVEKSFLFRADIMSSQYWSGVTVVSAAGINEVPMEAGGGRWSVYVKQEGQAPMEGISVYLFKDNGAYLNENSVTDAAGAVLFAVPEGTYKARADYLGYQFWTEAVAVNADAANNLNIIHEDVAIDVVGVYQGVADPLEGLNVYLFSEAGAYMNLNRLTAADGRAVFSLPERAYKVRADFLGQRYWTGVFTWENRTIEIPMAEAEITVLDGVPLSGVPVYVFTEAGAYLGISGTTGTDGKIRFRLPAGACKFRADYQNNQFWSGTALLTADQSNPVNIHTGGGVFSLTVMKSAAVPLVGADCYAFDEVGAYLGLTDVTDSAGRAGFDLSDGGYQFRVNYLGYMYWSDPLTVPDTLSDTMTIAHQDTQISVNSVYQGTVQPLAGVSTYLFSDSGVYMNRNKTTDAAGQAIFNLPEQPYKIRADYLSRQYWSDIFTWQDKTIAIPMAEAEITVTGNGQPLAGIPLYAFNNAGAYLNINGVTGSGGRATFRLPAGSYKFRADYQGSQYWSAITALTADQVNPIPVSVGGGTFTLTVLKNATDGLVGASCYLFSGAGAYLNKSAVTSSEGQVSFELSDGTYKIRVDYLGYQFWTGVFTVPTTLSEVLTIPHRNVAITVNKDYQGQTPLAGIPVYLFKPSGTYLSQSRTTDADGRVVFYLPDQAYKVRADYLGNQFWSANFQFADTAVTIPHNLVRVHVHRTGVDVAGAVVYLFTGSGSYLSRNQTTNSAGIVEFTLPEKAFKFRADQGGAMVYSSVVNVLVGQTQVVEINLE